MASTIEELESDITEATSPGFRGRLLDRGQARSMIWKDGVLPPNAPGFSPELSYDLLSYGYSLIGMGLRLREMGGNPQIYREAFSKAAHSIEDVIYKGDHNDVVYGFHNVLAASAYHLAQYSAKAYSLLRGTLNEGNISSIERGLCQVILRELDSLEEDILEWKFTGLGSDEKLANNIDQEVDLVDAAGGDDVLPDDHSDESIELSIVDTALTDNYFSALSLFLMALERGEESFLVQSIETLKVGLDSASDLNMVPQWWIHRITIHLIGDLWSSCFHKILPVEPPDGNGADWQALRWYFIALLYKRKKSEIDLWPSQIEGAKRATDQSDSLVVSLPTSAGKTRIAELCILRCLAAGKRVLFVTPLRALSAQTEVGLRKTFTPLGKSVSTLYGSIGTSDFEQDAIRTKNIVVGTPEKLDFALRNDPSLIDDVGLIVLDEGHMIGLNEREIRYEVQIQRLLKRPDADLRRIVCLSAILPEGDQLEDFVKWLRQDEEGEAVKSDWRPTDLMFGEVVWSGQRGKLNISVGEEQSFVPGFIESSIPSLPNPGVRTTSFPKNAQELSLATAWRLMEDNHTVLIYCPQKSSVEAFAKVIVDLNRRGALPSVLSVPKEYLELAKILGLEWLGEGHPILECLNIGVAVHHGSLPTPFRKEIEKLLRGGILKLTISSPTLAQGLNLAATAVIIQSLYRSGNKIEASEFKNVIGRAGRAFVDIQGLVIHPMFDRHDWRQGQWEDLINDTKTRNMESGLLRLVYSLVARMHENLGKPPLADLIEYVANNASGWVFHEVAGEDDERAQQMEKWSKYISSLDGAILSLIGESDVGDEEIPELLDEILASSLWQRRLARQEQGVQSLLNTALAQRAKHIWNNSTSAQRRGYFLAGVGLGTGQQLDAIAVDANNLLIAANTYVDEGNEQEAIYAITQLADLIFQIQPFTPITFPDNWKDILALWLRGEPIVNIDVGDIGDVLQFVEDGLVYRLPWGMEAVRVRAEANHDDIFEGMTIDDFETGLVVPAVENGSLNRSAAMLMQAGFSSRQAAIKAVNDCAATFTTSPALNVWLDSEIVLQNTLSGVWPTPQTASMWKAFIEEYRPSGSTIWSQESTVIPVAWKFPQAAPAASTTLRLVNSNDGQTSIVAANGDIVGQSEGGLNLLNDGIYYAVVNADGQNIDVTYIGPGESPFSLKGTV
jgi:superfamily II DNA/RNA helicase